MTYIASQNPKIFEIVKVTKNSTKPKLHKKTPWTNFKLLVETFHKI